MKTAIIYLILYLIIPPLTLKIGRYAKEQIKYSLYGRRRSNTAISQKESAIKPYDVFKEQLGEVAGFLEV